MARSLLWIRLPLAILLTVTIAACGGGGDDDEEEEEEIEDEDATGLWLGTFTQAGTSRPFGIIVAPSGQFTGLVANTNGTNGRLIVGSGDVTIRSFSGSGTVFAPANATLPNGQTSASLTVSGTATERVSLTGSWSGGGETATFNVTFDPKTSRGASLATLSGTYSLFPAPAGGQTNATLSINSLGAATFATSAGCNGTGQFAVINPAYNMYSFTLTVAACNSQPESTFSGLGALNDNPNGGTNNILTITGATAARDRPFAFNGSK